jgi:hypothetical protein
MRLWSLHPKYLDASGLVALWREGLLAQAVLAGRTRGYTRHPQLERFRGEPRLITVYLREVAAEAKRRGYRFDESKLPRVRVAGALRVTDGQLRYEWKHLKAKLRARDAAWYRRTRGIDVPEPHPLFAIVPGPVADWERRQAAG